MERVRKKKEIQSLASRKEEVRVSKEIDSLGRSGGTPLKQALD